MPEFKKDYRKGNGRDFSSRSNGPRPQMHKAVCSTCGKECVVPFVPTGNKPVLCSNCFEKTRDRNNDRSTPRDTQRSFSPDRPMYDAICDTCGNSCKIPFQPRTGKPVYCSNCFDSVVNPHPRQSEERNKPQNIDQFTQLHAKLDKILELLSQSTSMKTATPNEVVEEEIAAKTEENAEVIVEVIESPKKKPRASKKPPSPTAE
ncbi:hypothetical protein BH11PAT1_BH11PAT1_5950 [soil metagenome]